MPFVMQLQGPGKGPLRLPRRALRGVGNVIMLNPIALFGGLALGGLLAYYRVKPRSLLGGRRRKRL